MERPIDLSTWPRRAHYAHFRAYAIPHFTVCARVPVDGARARARAGQGSLFAEMLYAVARATNTLGCMRLRLRPEGVIEHDRLDPSFTAPGPAGTFQFRITPWIPERERFLGSLRAQQQRWAEVLEPDLDVPERDDLLWVSCLAGLDFTALQPALRCAPLDSVPMIHWGRVVPRPGGGHEVGLALTVHHALVDGADVSAWVEQVAAMWGQEALDPGPEAPEPPGPG